MMRNSQNLSRFWDNYFLERKCRKKDLHWGFEWLRPHIGFLKQRHVKKILDIGCGTGSDCIRLSELGFEVVGVDVSKVAIKWAKEKAAETKAPAVFQKMDIAKGFDFEDESFDAVISHLVLHMFSDSETKKIFDHIWRLLKPYGFFIFEVNSFMDIRYRPHKRVKKLEPFFFLEDHGQTMHFFTKRYIKTLLKNWQIHSLKHVKMTSVKGTKCVWHCLAQKV